MHRPLRPNKLGPADVHAVPAAAPTYRPSGPCTYSKSCPTNSNHHLVSNETKPSPYFNDDSCRVNEIGCHTHKTRLTQTLMSTKIWADYDTSSLTNLPKRRCSGLFSGVEGDAQHAGEGDVRHARHACLERSFLFRSDVAVEGWSTVRVSEGESGCSGQGERREPVFLRAVERPARVYIVYNMQSSRHTHDDCSYPPDKCGERDL